MALDFVLIFLFVAFFYTLEGALVLPGISQVTFEQKGDINVGVIDAMTYTAITEALCGSEVRGANLLRNSHCTFIYYFKYCI